MASWLAHPLSQSRCSPCGDARSFSHWLHGHTLAAALKAKCGCSAAAASLRDLLSQRREGQRPGDARAGAAARTLALRPGGEVTRRFLAVNPVVLQVGSTLFVHGGVLRHHVDYGLERINRETQVGGLRGSGSRLVGRGAGAAAAGLA